MPVEERAFGPLKHSPMQDLSTIATDQEAATDWVKNNVARYMFPGGVKIRWVAVGNEAFGTWQYVSPAITHSRHVSCSIGD
jgi:hypothetical protein